MFIHIPEFCSNCGSITFCESKPGPSAKRLLGAAGFHSYFCKECGHSWSQLSPYQIILNLICLIIIAMGALLLFGVY